MKKFELATDYKVNHLGKTLCRIRACTDFVTAHGVQVHAGDLGGFVEQERNLSQDGSSWIFGDAKVFGGACVCGDAQACDDVQVFKSAIVYGRVIVSDNARIFGNAEICDDSEVFGNAKVHDSAKIGGKTIIRDSADVGGGAYLFGNYDIGDDAKVYSLKHIFFVSPILREGYSLTAFRTKNDEIKISIWSEVYTIDEFKKVVSGWDDRQKSIALGALEIAQKHIVLPTVEEVS